MNAVQSETLDIIQQVLRQSLLALAASSAEANKGMLAREEAASHNEALHPVARAMLAELSESAGIVAPFSATKQ